MKVRVADKLAPLLEPKKFKVIFGGRGSGKSMTVADLLLIKVMQGEKVGCMREMMNSIDDSVHALMCEEVERLQLPGFTIQNNAIYHTSGGEIKYKGVARNPESVKSMHGFNVFWVEEAATLSKKSIDLLVPTLRAEGSELWLTFNPGSSADPISQEFLKPFEGKLKDGFYEDELYMVIRCNYSDNPFFPENLEQLRLKHLETKPSAEYKHVWEGDYNDAVDNAIIKTDWFDAAIDAHKKDRLKEAFKPRGIRVTAYDPMDGGNDAHGLAVRHGSIIQRAECRDDGEIDVGCDWATGIASRLKSDWFIWDGDGMGAGLKRQVSDAFAGKVCKHHLFKGSSSGSGQDNAEQVYDSDDHKSTTHADTFKNNRAQYYTKLAKRFYNTYRVVTKGEYVDPDECISIDSEGVPDIERLRSEVCRIPRKMNNTGLIQIMSKQEMAKLDIPSPNMSDAIMMALWGPKIKKTWGKLNITGSSIA